jgi:hypothetical protein
MQPGDEITIEEEALRVAALRLERVLDVGGAEKPLRAATHVMDIVPYERRRVDEGRGALPERFNEDTWLRYDVCNLPWPWQDDWFDFVWCSQVVEDIRDPIGVCKEMQRVGKAGFISTVHRSYESSVVQYDGVVGYHHHRWLIEPALEGLIFVWKSPILHVDPTTRPPHPEQWLLHIRWEGSFNAEELFTGGDQAQYAELRAYARRFER